MSFSTAVSARHHKGYQSLERLIEMACSSGTEQARHVADFLLAWYNASENGRWDLTDFWIVDDAIADDMLDVLRFIRSHRCYPDELGYAGEFATIWRKWRA